MKVSKKQIFEIFYDLDRGVQLFFIQGSEVAFVG